MIKEALEASLVEGKDQLNTEVSHIYASDLMSDVLAFGQPSSLLITGLASDQAIISAHMAEFVGVVLIRGKKTREGAIRLARQHNLVLLSTALDMYESCIRLSMRKTGRLPALAGMHPKSSNQEMLLSRDLFIEGSDFANAGMVSTEVKATLKKIGFDPGLIRRVAISTYEAEMNVVMHAKRARVNLSITPTCVELTIDDEGKGIPSVEDAMQEGWTTATEEMRKMGFGSGMGLPNINRNSDDLHIESRVGEGTLLSMKFFT